MRINQILLKEMKLEIPKRTGDIDLLIIRNPSGQTLLNVASRSIYGNLRGLAFDNDTYWWDANEANHDEVLKAMGLPLTKSPHLHLYITQSYGRNFPDGAGIISADDGQMQKGYFQPQNKSMQRILQCPMIYVSYEDDDERVSYVPGKLAESVNYGDIGHNTTTIKRTLYFISGRIDNGKKMISLRASYFTPENQHLNEKQVDRCVKLLSKKYPGYKIWYFGEGDPELLAETKIPFGKSVIDLVKNPSVSKLLAMLRQSKNGLRGLRNGSDMYWWDGDVYQALHGDVAKYLDYPDYSPNRFFLHKDSQGYGYIDYENPESLYDWLQHPQLKKYLQCPDIYFSVGGHGFIPGPEALKIATADDSANNPNRTQLSLPVNDGTVGSGEVQMPQTFTGLDS